MHNYPISSCVRFDNHQSFILIFNMFIFQSCVRTNTVYRAHCDYLVDASGKMCCSHRINYLKKKRNKRKKRDLNSFPGILIVFLRAKLSGTAVARAFVWFSSLGHLCFFFLSLSSRHWFLFAWLLLEYVFRSYLEKEQRFTFTQFEFIAAVRAFFVARARERLHKTATRTTI